MRATCGRHLWCAAIALDLHNKVSHLTFQNQACPSSEYILFHKCRCKAMHRSKHWTLKELQRGFVPLSLLRCVMKQHSKQFPLGLFQEFSVSWALVFLLFYFQSFFFHQNLKLSLKMQVTLSGRQFHGSTPVWSINQIMTGFFELQWWEWCEMHNLLLQ